MRDKIFICSYHSSRPTKCGSFRLQSTVLFEIAVGLQIGLDVLRSEKCNIDHQYVQFILAHGTCRFNNRTTCVGLYLRSISLFTVCLSQRGVGDSGKPTKVWCQCQQTEDRRVNACLSVQRHLPNLNGQRSSSVSQSLEYRRMYARIRTVSSISTGRSFKFYERNTIKQLLHIYFCSSANILQVINFFTGLIFKRNLYTYFLTTNSYVRQNFLRHVHALCRVLTSKKGKTECHLLYNASVATCFSLL